MISNTKSLYYEKGKAIYKVIERNEKIHKAG